MRYFRRLAMAAAAAALAIAGLATAASAATPQCSAVPGPACGSWNAEVPNLPDLDVQGAAAVSGNVLIVYTRSAADRAEDFIVVPVNPAATSKYTVTGSAHSFSAGVTTAPANSVAIEYAPKGVPSGLFVSTVNPNGHAAAQLRVGSNNVTTFNPFQTFTSAAAHGDFTAVQFTEVINGNVLTDPRNDGSIGVKGHRVQVIFAENQGHTGQFWGQNGA